MGLPAALREWYVFSPPTAESDNVSVSSSRSNQLYSSTTTNADVRPGLSHSGQFHDRSGHLSATESGREDDRMYESDTSGQLA